MTPTGCPKSPISSRPLISAGQPTPPFRLSAASGRVVSTEDLKGSPAVLVFYPADWSPVCGDELDVFNLALPYFGAVGATVLGISVDSVWSHRAFADAHHLHFDLLSDFEPKGAVSKLFGLYNATAGQSKRGLVLVDSSGRVAWSSISGDDINPGVDEILEALEALGEPASSKTLVEL